MVKKYEISDKDIKVALRFLKFNDPENATRDQAIALLEDLQSGFHGMAHYNPELLLKLQQEIDSKKPQEDSSATN
ncbi:MAG TPA: hypothetical protein VIH90_01515 [Candidatus Saccharimonadales bacterium]